MSGYRVHGARDLARLAARIRARHDEKVCACICDCLPDEPGMAATLEALPAPPPMDARGRKWAAEKLLRPILTEDGEEDFTPEEWLELCRQTWEICIAGSSLKPQISAERVQFIAEQFRETVSFARRAWGMHDRPAAGQSPGGEDNELAQ